MHRRNLSLAFAILVEASDDPRNDQARMAGLLTQANKVAVRLNLFSVAGQVENRLLLFRRKDRAARQPVKKRL